MSPDHLKTIQELDANIQEANRIKHARTKILKNLKAETAKTKVLIEQLNEMYGIKRD